MKIAVVTYALEVGGVEVFIKNIYNYLNKKGHEVIILETLRVGKWSKLFCNNGYIVERILPKYCDSRIKHVKAIAKFLNKFDLIILNDAPYGQAALGLLNNRIVAISVLHNDLNSIINNAIANCENWDAIIAVSPKLLTIIETKYFVKNKTFCIPNGVEIHDLKKQFKLEESSLKPLRLIYIGNMNHEQKGIFYLPDIFIKVKSIFPNVQIDLLGDGVDLKELKRRFNKIMGSEVCFHGYVENSTALEILKESDALLMPSHFEGLPIVLLEAMSQGVVPVVSLLDGITDFVITDKLNGRLISVGDVQGFVDAILQLATNRDKLKCMSIEARKTAENRFSYQVMGKKYLDISLELIQKRRINKSSRNGKIDLKLVGDFPHLPIYLVRPLRKILKFLGLYKPS